MKILAIETSCDETAIALIRTEDSGSKESLLHVLGNILYSQAPLHAKYGGVFPTLAKREHQKKLVPILKEVLTSSLIINKIPNDRLQKIETILSKEPDLLEQFLNFASNVQKPDIDAVAVTYGPGLEPALWVGINFALALSVLWNIPLIPINHMEGHIFSALLEKRANKTILSGLSFKTAKNGDAYQLQTPTFPALALLVSGGHTELVLMKEMFDYKVVGETRDDAVGEAFDKTARMLDLPYPGGPHISRLAEQARTDLVNKDLSSTTESGEENVSPVINFPRPMMNADNFDFSFSGLKTAVRYKVQDIGIMNENIKRNIAKEFENAAIETIVTKTLRAVKRYSAKTLIIGGGVAANKHLRKELDEMILNKSAHTKLFLPEHSLSGDNAIMIAAAAVTRAHKFGLNTFKVCPTLKADGNLKL
jgi:N6-L-threonylcarbamoyladenine synthase